MFYFKISLLFLFSSSFDDFKIVFTLTLLECRAIAEKKNPLIMRLVLLRSLSRNINQIFNKFVQEKNGDMIAVNCEAVRLLTHSFIKCRNGIDSREAQSK